jgi:sugar/nucleoside kinase (ribokinase family)
MKHVLAFGNPVYDMILTPIVTRKERVLSGCSTNACLAVAKLGQKATLVGCVGPDFQQHMENDMAKYHVEGRLLPSKQTGGFSLVYDERGNRELTILGIAENLPDDVDNLPQADFVLIGPILGETSSELVRAVRRQVQAPVLLDPQGLLRMLDGDQVVHRVTRVYEEVAAMSDIVKANELETQVVTGIDPRQDPVAAVKALYQCGCKIAITTLAEAGSIIFDGQNIIEIPPYVTNAIDPTGAGDTYAAGFMTKYMENPQDLLGAGCFASCVSSVMIENVGPAFPLTYEEASRRAAVLLAGPHHIKL